MKDAYGEKNPVFDFGIYVKIFYENGPFIIIKNGTDFL